MAELFADFTAFKAHIGGAINTSVDMRSLEPIIFDTARAHIVPYLSQPLYDSLLATPATSANAALLPYVQRALAKLSMFEYQKIGNVQFGEAGLHRIETDSRKSAYKYQEKNYTEYFLNSGYADIERMLQFLHTNQSTYPTWRDSDEGNAHLTTLLNYASQVRIAAQRDMDRWTFETLKPMISFAIDWMVKAVMPKQQYDSLVNKNKLNTLTADDKALLLLIRKAVANRAISEGIKQRWVQYSQGRVKVIEFFGDSSASNETLPPQVFTAAYWQGDLMSQQYMRAWQDYMTPTLFPLAYDVSSGGTNADADAWHVNTVAEAEQVAADRHVEQNRSIFKM